MATMRINGHDAEIDGRSRAIYAYLADGSSTPIEAVEVSRMTAGVVKAFVKKHPTATVVWFYDSFSFRYSTPWEMSWTRGRVEVTVKYNPDGTVIDRERRQRGG